MKNKKRLVVLTLLLIIVVVGIVIVLVVRNNQNTSIVDQTTPVQSSFLTSDNITSINGNITSLSNGTITVSTSDGNGDRLVTTSNNTRLTKTVTTTKDKILLIGQTIVVQGTKNETVIDATAIIYLPRMNRNQSSDSSSLGIGSARRINGTGQIGVNSNFTPSNQFGKSYAAAGSIQSITGDTVVISNPRGGIFTINIFSDTKYETTIQAQLTDLASGLKISIIGNQDKNGIITARTLTIL